MRTTFIIAGILIFIFFVLLALFFLNSFNQPLPKPIPVTRDFNKNYNNFNYIIPGKSTYNDVLKLNGQPISSKEEGEQLVLLYQTPNSTYNNTVVIKNGTVSYAIEYVYSSYRGTYSDYLKKLGLPELSLYYDNPEKPTWFIFLKLGIAIESSNNEITRIVYFIPQNKTQFMAEIGKTFDLKETPPVVEGEPL